MAKKIAVLVRERQGEALRVAVGLTLDNDRVEVYVLDRKVAATPGNAANIEVLGEMGMRIATNCADNEGSRTALDRRTRAARSPRATSSCRTSGRPRRTSMKILYLLTRDLGATGAALRHEHAKEHAVEVIDLRSERRLRPRRRRDRRGRPGDLLVAGGARR